MVDIFRNLYQMLLEIIIYHNKLSENKSVFLELVNSSIVYLFQKNNVFQHI